MSSLIAPALTTRSRSNNLERQDPHLLPLLDRPLILVAHPDDETACATLLQRAYDPMVFFCTDGAPTAEFFWRSYGSRREYTLLRRSEAKRALAVLGLKTMYQLRDRITRRAFKDQELYRELDRAFPALIQEVPRVDPGAILAPAYEGGHPDHDACSFLAYLLGQELKIPVWEMPLYFRGQNGRLIHQEFLNVNGTEVALCPTTGELQLRAEMLAAYVSQRDAASFIKSPLELFRPQPDYDYSRAPHQGPLNYELWHWPMTGLELCQAFELCLAQLSSTDEKRRQVQPGEAERVSSS
jgi:LmbE family N-acetylglucosaminyl deacetylase